MRGGDGIADSAGCGDGLVEVHAGGRVVTALRRVPHELAHQHRGVGLARVQLAADRAAEAAVADRVDLAEVLAGGREKRRRRRATVGAVERPEAFADAGEVGQLGGPQLAGRRGPRR